MSTTPHAVLLGQLHSTTPSKVPLLRRSRQRLRFDYSPENLAKWASSEFEADPVDDLNLRNSLSWQTQAAMMNNAWSCVLVLSALSFLLLCAHKFASWRYEKHGRGIKDLFATFLRQSLCVDLRALALCRIWLASVMLWDVLQQAWYIRLLRTDQSLLPRSVSSDLFFCPHCWSATFAWQTLLMAPMVGLLLSLVLGCYTSISTVLTFLMWTSMVDAIEPGSQGGDRICNVLLFWASFLPWSSRFSIDAARLSSSKLPCRSITLASPAVLGLMLSILDIYVSTAQSRSGSDWNEDYSAVWNIFHDPSTTKPLGHFLLGYPGFCRFLAFAAMKVEFWSPIFLFGGTLCRGIIRGLACISMVGLHAGLGLTVALGWFQCIAVSLWLVFLPSVMCDRFEHHSRQLGSVLQNRIPFASFAMRQARSNEAFDAGSDIELSAAVNSGRSGGVARRRQAKAAEDSHALARETDETDGHCDENNGHFESLPVQHVMVPQVSMGLKDCVASCIIIILLAVRFGADGFPASIARGLGYPLHWHLFQETKMVYFGKDILVGTLADGVQIHLNGLGIHASRTELLLAARTDNNTEAWFDISETLGPPVEEHERPRYMRNLAGLMRDHRDTRLMYLQNLCSCWNGLNGSLHDPQRLLVIDVYFASKIGFVDPGRGFMGIDGFRLHSKKPFQCNRTWQEHLKEEGWTEDEIQRHRVPSKEELSDRRDIARGSIHMEKMMLAHMHKGGLGEDKFHVDYTVH